MISFLTGDLVFDFLLGHGMLFLVEFGEGLYLFGRGGECEFIRRKNFLMFRVLQGDLSSRQFDLLIQDICNRPESGLIFAVDSLDRS